MPMNARLTNQEIASFRDALRGYEPAKEVLDNLQNHQGDFEASFNHLFGDRQSFDGDQSLWKDTLETLREVICGDQGFRARFKAWRSDSSTAPLLEGAVSLLIGKAVAMGIPLDAGSATFICMFLVHLGPDAFCGIIGQPSPPDETQE